MAYLLTIVVVIVVVTIVLEVFVLRPVRREEVKKFHEQGEAALRGIEKKKKEEYLLFYNQAKRIGVNIDNVYEKKSDLEILNDNRHFFAEDVDIVAEYFKAYEYHKQNKTEKEKQQKDEYIKYLEKCIANQEYVSELIGKDKYLDLITRRLNEINRKTVAYENEKAKQRKAYMESHGLMGSIDYGRGPNLSWNNSELAGAATALGGPLSGMMVISDSPYEQAPNNEYIGEEKYRKQ